MGIILDREWVGPVPIWCYLIEHPEGLFVVDAGDNARNSRKNYMPKTNPFFQYAVKINVAPEEEIGVRLADMGIDPALDVRQLLMTHLHQDKVDGVTMNVQTSLASQRAVKAFARSEPSVLLLEHDPDVPERLANKQVLFDTGLPSQARPVTSP